jgi:hypothetical protein
MDLGANLVMGVLLLLEQARVQRHARLHRLETRVRALRQRVPVGHTRREGEREGLHVFDYSQSTMPLSTSRSEGLSSSSSSSLEVWWGADSLAAGGADGLGAIAEEVHVARQILGHRHRARVRLEPAKDHK